MMITEYFSILLRKFKKITITTNLKNHYYNKSKEKSFLQTNLKQPKLKKPPFL